MKEKITFFEECIYKILRWSEKYTKTDMVYLFQNGGWSLIGQVFGAILSFLIVTAFANFVSQEGYGTYKYIITILGVVSATYLTGSGQAITQGVARGFEGVLKSVKRDFLSWSKLFSFIAITIAVFYFIKEEYTIAFSLLIIAITSPVTESNNLYVAFLEGKQDFKRKMLWGLIHVGVPSLAIFLSIVLSGKVIVIIATYFISYLVVSTFLYRMTLRSYKPNEKQDPTVNTFGKHTSFMNILGGISFQLDKILLFNTAGPSLLAMYSVAIAPPQQLRITTKIISSLLLPKLSKRTVTELRKSIPRKALLAFLAGLVVCIGYIIITPFVFEIFFPTYINVVPYSQAYALLILFYPSILFQQSLSAQLEHKKLYIVQLGIPIIKIITMFFLVPLYGIWGIIGTMIGMEILRMILVIVLFFMMKEKNVVHGNETADLSEM